MESKEIRIVGDKAEVTKTVSEVTVHTLEDLNRELETIQEQIDRLLSKRDEVQEIINQF